MPDELSESGRRSSGDASTLSLFAVMWALAALWHLLGNPAFGSAWSEALLAAAAGLVLWRPGALGPLGLLAGAGIVSVWEEAPVTGNHWFLVGFVDLALLAALAVSAWPGRRVEATDVVRRFVPAARLCLIVAYGFAAFSKLNRSFLDPDVSCATYFFDKTTDSLGVSALQAGGARWVGMLVVLTVITTELAIPVLLVIRRTRNLGVAVGLVFHGVLALDRTSHVFDFSSMLFALFVLFLPPSAGAWAAERVGSVRARLALRGERQPRAVHLLLVALPVAAGLLLAMEAITPSTAAWIGWCTWLPYSVVAILATLRFLHQRPAADPRPLLRPHHVAYLVVPLLVVMNGLSPYLELKSSYGWNMYSNLRTVGGESNHLLVRRTLPLSDVQDDLVQIIRSNDPALASYGARDYALTWRQLRVYLAAHPDVHVVYDRGHELVSLAPASSHPELVEPVPAWQEKLQPFRPVDLHDEVRCVPAFGPAR